MSLGTLYSNGHLCPFTHRVQIAAAELGSPIDVVYDGDIPDDVRAATPPGSWPAFAPADGGDLMHDSSQIVDCLIAGSGAVGEAYRSDPALLAKLNALTVCISKVMLAGNPSIQFAHFEFEEATFLPVLSELDLEQHLTMLEGAYEMCILERPHLIGVLTSYMPIEDTLSLIDSLLHAVEPDSDEWRNLVSAMHRSMSAEQWLRITRRFEDTLPTSMMVVPSGHRRQTLGAAARALGAAAPVDRIEIPATQAVGGA